MAFIQCAGSRDPEHLPYCSDFCCTASLKQALYVREQNPNATAMILYKDIRTPGQTELFYKAGTERSRRHAYQGGDRRSQPG